MKRLLIAYDGSECAEAALEELSLAGLPRELEVVVLSVAEVWLPANPDRLDPGFKDNMPATARQAHEQALAAVESSRSMAKRAAERLRSLFPKWNVIAEAQADSPAWAVIKKADHWHADLVVVGSHGRSLLERAFLGSVSQKVIAEAHCSVRVCRLHKRAQDGRLRVVVAVDGWADSNAAVRAVASRAWPELAEFHVATVADPRLETTLAGPGALGSDWVRENDSGVREAIVRLVEHSAKQLVDAGCKVETHIFSGDPKRELLRHAETWDADSIFLGARGQQHGERLTLGTMASAVATRARCSVEIVRPD